MTHAITLVNFEGNIVPVIVQICDKDLRLSPGIEIFQQNSKVYPQFRGHQVDPNDSVTRNFPEP